VRTFIAVDITHEVRERIIQFIQVLQKVGGNIKWVHPENIHITLYFLGEVDEKTITSVEKIIQASMEGIRAFPVSVEGISVFPSMERPRVLWAGVKNGSGELKKIYHSIHHTLIREAIDVKKGEKEYIPHLTLGRVKGRCDQKLVNEMNKAFNRMFGHFSVHEVVLYQSTLTKSGPLYDRINGFSLK